MSNPRELPEFDLERGGPYTLIERLETIRNHHDLPQRHALVYPCFLLEALLTEYW
jgi:hypothetical protein